MDGCVHISGGFVSKFHKPRDDSLKFTYKRGLNLRKKLNHKCGASRVGMQMERSRGMPMSITSLSLSSIGFGRGERERERFSSRV